MASLDGKSEKHDEARSNAASEAPSRAEPKEMSLYAEVAVAIPRRELFTYRIPEKLRESAKRGARVLVQFNRRKEAGVIVRLLDELPESLREVKILPILQTLDSEPYFTEELLNFIEEAARYYFHPLGEVLKSFSPPVRRDQIASLKRGGSLAGDEELRGVKARSRERDYVLATGSAAERKLGAAQLRVLDALGEEGEADAIALMRETGASRAVLRRLEELGLIRTERRLRPADPFFAEEVAREAPPELTAEQRAAVESITEALRGAPEAFLLKGITGSGKTEVYLRAIEEARAQNKGAILLVPEISLTPQLVGRFRARFGDELAVLHSGLDASAREEAMRALRAGELHVAIGARSALFSPIEELGLIIVDEEHDPSFKQEEGFRYQARDMALLRAHRAGAVAILGSATPSFESMYGAERGRLRLLTLSERATGAKLPAVEIVDLRRYPMGRDGEKLISFPLAEALRECLEAKGQAIIFLNRRGYLPALRCEQCGAPEECPSCSVAMTAHKSEGRLRCHYCDHATPLHRKCTLCGAEALTSFSLGTERLEEALSAQLPEAKIARLDRDVANHKSLERLLADFRAQRYDILVGTQMVTKGHDIPNVTLVGVILADQSLSFSDFRASERTFQLLSQVAGRAGRGDRAGRVLIQTYQPTNDAIVSASRHDYDGFYANAINERRDPSYPPFAHLALLRIDSPDGDLVERESSRLAALLMTHAVLRDEKVELLGPAPAQLRKLRNRHRFQIFLRSEERAPLRHVLRDLLPRLDSLKGVRISIDIDPYSTL